MDRVIVVPLIMLLLSIFVVYVVSLTGTLAEKYAPWIISIASWTTTLTMAAIKKREEDKRKKEIDVINKLVQKEELTVEVSGLTSRKERTKAEMQHLQGRIRSYEEYIRRNLPSQAKQVAKQTLLNEKKFELERSLAKEYREWRDVNSQLTGSTSMGEDIQNAIEDSILPKYIREKRLEDAKSLLIVITSVFGVITFLWPFIPLQLSLPIFLIPLSVVGAYILRNYVRTLPKQTVIATLKFGGSFIAFTGSCVVAFIGISLLASGALADPDTDMLALAFLAAGSMSAIPSGAVLFKMAMTTRTPRRRRHGTT
ncbi:hypothetical protein MUP77_05495 [Candidatus Bathyarchaeota archaeon]|nr:hypothetical protein [Candidatus Bathyarchaeota archaeon]